MANEREKVLSSVVSELPSVTPRSETSANGSNLDSALSTAESTKQLELSHKHDMERLHAELGWFGKVFGSESHAAIVIAFVVIIFGFGTAIGLWVTAAHSNRPEYWASEAHLALGAATAALAYVFGKASKDPSK